MNKQKMKFIQCPHKDEANRPYTLNDSTILEICTSCEHVLAGQFIKRAYADAVANSVSNKLQAQADVFNS